MIGDRSIAPITIYIFFISKMWRKYGFEIIIASATLILYNELESFIIHSQENLCPVAKLSIRLLGIFQAERDSKLLTGFRSDKVRALLAYLSVEAQHPWTRSSLADLFWPNYPELKAQSNLRNALWNLHNLTGDTHQDEPFILISGSSVQFNPAADYWLDVRAFLEMVAKNCPHTNIYLNEKGISALEGALSLYHGDFLAGFTVDSPVFETWVVKTREHLHQNWVTALRCLSLSLHKLGDQQRALDYAKAWIEQETWDEAAYRHSMDVLLALGRRTAALALFEACQTRLAEDLDVEPEPETIQKYEKIKHGVLVQPSLTTPLPHEGQKPTPTDPGHLPRQLYQRAQTFFEPGLFVGRQKELAQLETWLADVLHGHGKPAFIMGEPGSGKTYLMKEFVIQALQQDPNLLALWGQCNAFTGQGDPYYPFMNMTRLLAGDIEPLLPGSVINLPHLERIWRCLPETLTHLVDYGPDLIRRFLALVNPSSLASTHPSISPVILDSINTLIKSNPTLRMSQSLLNDQFTQVVSALSKDYPLILILDDLQWIDPGSASLLFHLGRGLAGQQIFLVGAFRPVEVFAGHKEQTHTMDDILNEFKACFGEIIINLADSEGQDFVNALLDSEPNKFSQNFYEKLYKHTSGHPLFTIELLRGMQLRKEILRNQAGQWVESANLRWNELPARVEAVIARRINMMPSECQALMAPACVYGEVFSVEILAKVMGIPENDVFELLSRQVGKRHRLISAQGVTQIGEQRLTHYAFRHVLFQIYLYNQLDIVEKTRLHGLIANELENIYIDHINQFPEMAHTLARHFELAQNDKKALNYYTQAGKNAAYLTAHQEALRHFYHALDIIHSLPPTPDRDRAELDIQISLGPPLTALKGWGAPELEVAYNRTQALIEKSDDTTSLIPMLWLLATFRIGRSEHAEADRLVSRLFKLAQQANDPTLLALTYFQVSPFYQGKLPQARIILERASALQDINQQRFLAQRYGMAPAAIALAYLSNCLWLMGFPDQADKVSDRASALVKAIAHPMTSCYVISRSCWMGMLKSNPNHVQTHAEQLFNISAKYGFKNFEFAATFFMNWVKFKRQVGCSQAIEAMNAVIEAYYSTKTVLNRTAFLVFFAQVCLEGGEISRGFEHVNESIKLGEQTSELWFQAEAWRTKGELMLIGEQRPNIAGAQTCFETALQIAREQAAKTFELRAAISLTRLWQGQNRTEAACQLFSEVYGWFTEGFKSEDLQEAKALLESLQN
jgi:predicted ATPase/DNA-binding SARP family transcriptional activator